MPNVMAAPPIGCTLCKCSVIPFLVPCRKAPLLECHAVTLPIYENARLERKVKFARSKIPSGAKAPKNVYIMYQPRKLPKILQSSVGLR